MSSSSAETFLTDDAATWHRVHPISPLVRGWVAVAGVMVIFGRNSLEDVLRSSARGNAFDGGNAPAWVVLGVLVAAIVLFGGIFFLSWFFTRYQVTDDHVRVNSGFLFRQQRQARIDRVQAIEVIQPLLARLFGLAELKFDVADAGRSAMKLSFLSLDEARRLRAAILARAAGVAFDPAVPAMVREAPEHQVLAVPPARIAAATLFSGITVFAALMVAAGSWAAASSGHWSVLFLFLPFALAITAAYWKAFTTDFNFRVAVSPDGVRLHYGMLETRSQTIPPGRVQAVGISQNPLWRLFGWFRIHVNVAGYGRGGREQASRSVLLPIGTRAEVFLVLGLIFPDPGIDNPFEVFNAGLSGTGTAAGFVHSPARARWVDPFGWRRTAFLATRTALLCRHGILFRRLQVVPHERTQSLSLEQGPIKRLLGLVDFELHSTPGPVKPLVHHLGADIARSLFDAQASRAAHARRLAGRVPVPVPVPVNDAGIAVPNAGIAVRTDAGIAVQKEQL